MWTLFLQASLLILILMSLLWVISVMLKNVSIVDLFWGPGFVIINAFFDYLEGEGRIKVNPVPRFRKKYLKAKGTNHNSQRRQLISVQDAAKLVSITLDTRDRAIKSYAY